MDCSPPGSSVHGDSPGKNTAVGCHFPGDLPNLGIEPRALASEFFTTSATWEALWESACLRKDPNFVWVEMLI